VGRITGVSREPSQLVAQVQAEPLAMIDRAREVMLIEFDPAHPAAPPAAQALSDAGPPAPAEGGR